MTRLSSGFRSGRGTITRGCRLGLTAALIALALATGAAAQYNAADLFARAQPLVYQIRVIDLASGDKFSIGSGFAVADDGRIATNFHVVASFVHEPEKHRLEAVAHDDTISALKLLAIDVVHDLAIVTTEDPAASHLPLARAQPAKGDRIYSMGNPLDLGMTIIEGTFNGLVENSRYRKILFSGSLNAGMSGGPAFNAQGEVMGINVSKGGEQLSFLVPVDHLAALLQKSGAPDSAPDFKAAITADLLADQREFHRTVIDPDGDPRILGELRFMGELSDSLKCWGHSVDEADIRYKATHQHCTSQDRIYVSDDLYVGGFRFDLEWVTTRELNRFQFYNVLEQRFVHPVLRNTDNPELVTPFDCHGDQVELASGVWKISSCLRAYNDYEGLYDASMVMALLDYPHKSALVKVNAAGISAGNATRLLRTVAESIAWTH